MSRGRLPLDPRPIKCTGCGRPPRFRERTPVDCVCGSPPHPLAYLALRPADHALSAAELRRCREIVRASV